MYNRVAPQLIAGGGVDALTTATSMRLGSCRALRGDQVRSGDDSDTLQGSCNASSQIIIDFRH